MSPRPITGGGTEIDYVVVEKAVGMVTAQDLEKADGPIPSPAAAASAGAWLHI